MSEFVFHPARYGPVVAGLLASPRLADLGPGSPEKTVEQELRRFNIPTDLGNSLTDLDAARACHAGLWLYFDFLHESHEISQELETPEGSFWHAIMHRREPDAWNSKYWWRKVGVHPVFESLARESPTIGYSFKSAESFVDYCEKAPGAGSKEEDIARRVQLLEWQLLFDWCHDKAIGR